MLKWLLLHFEFLNTLVSLSAIFHTNKRRMNCVKSHTTLALKADIIYEQASCVAHIVALILGHNWNKCKNFPSKFSCTVKITYESWRIIKLRTEIMIYFLMILLYYDVLIYNYCTKQKNLFWFTNTFSLTSLKSFIAFNLGWSNRFYKFRYKLKAEGDIAGANGGTGSIGIMKMRGNISQWMERINWKYEGQI